MGKQSRVFFLPFEAKSTEIKEGYGHMVVW